MLFKYGYAEGRFWEAMMELLHDGLKAGWWSRHAGILPSEFLDFLSLENGVQRVRSYVVDIVPGLFRTPEYAACLSNVGGNEADVRFLEMWMTRKQVLDRANPPQCDVVLTEAALRQQVGGPETMRAQLRHLADLSMRNHLRLRLIPFAAGPHRGLAKPFTLLNVGRHGSLTIAALESRIGLDFEERDDKVRLFAEIFADLQTTALPEDDSRSFIDQLSSDR